MVPRKPGERVKTDRRDAIKLARPLRAGELDPVWVPDAAHKAMRDLVRTINDGSQEGWPCLGLRAPTTRLPRGS